MIDHRDNICITKNFVASCKNRIKLTRLAEKLQEMGYSAGYGVMKVGGKTIRGVAIPLREILSPEVTGLLRNEENIFIQKIVN